MVNRVHDTFTDTAGTLLTAHVGESGASWVVGAGYSTVSTNIPVIDSTGGRVRGVRTGGQILFASGVATGDGEYAEITVDWLTVAGGVGVLARAGNIGGVPRGYMAYFTGSQVSILRADNSTTFTTVAAAVAHTPTVGTHKYKITVTGTGASVAIDVKADGVTVHSGTDSTANRITTFGSAGVYFDTTASDTAGAHITEIYHEDPNAVSAAPTFTFTSPAEGRIFQRSGSSGTISVAGTYAGTPTAIEARLVLDGTNTAVTGFDWSTKVASPAGNSFSFNFSSVPEGIWYNVQTRDSANPSNVFISGKVGVGAIVAVVGQSNAWYWFHRGDSTLTPSANLRVIGSGSDNGIASANVSKVWQVADTATMNGAIACGNQLVGQLNTLIALVDVTWDGSGLTVTGNTGQWIPLTNAPYTKAKAFLQTITSSLEAVMVVNGETDGAQGVSQATFYAGLGTLFSALRTDFSNANMPIIMALLGKRTDGAITDVNAEAIRNAQVQKASDPYVYRVARYDLTRNADGVHLDAPGFTKLGKRAAQALAYALGKATFYRGPRIGSVIRVSPTIYDVNLAHDGGTDYTPTSGISTFRALDGTTSATISSAVYQTATSVRITLASSPAGTVTIQNSWGTQPDVTAPLLDNSSLALPLEFSDGVTASLSQGQSMATFFNDTFTTGSTSSLTAHTADSGGTWVALAGSGTQPYVMSSFGGIATCSSALSTSRSSVIAPGPDVTVSATMYYDSANILEAGILLRCSADGSSAYIGGYSTTLAKWYIGKITAADGTRTTLASASSTSSYTSASAPNVVFSAVGNLLTLKVDGVTMVQFSDTSYQNAGYVGIIFNPLNSTRFQQGIFFNSLSADSVAAQLVNPTLTNLTVPTYDSVSATGSVTTDDASGTLYWLYNTSSTATSAQVKAGQSKAVTASGAQTLPGTGLSPSTLYYLHVVQTDPSGGESAVLHTSFTTAVAASPTITGITISPAPATVPGGSTQQFTVTVLGTNGPSQSVNLTGTAVPYLNSTTSNSPVFTAPAATASDQTFTLIATTADNSFTTTATITVPLAAGVPIPTMMQPKDRVRETSTSTSTSTITLSGTAPTQYRTFANAYTVGTKGVPVFFGDQGAANWMTCLCTLVSSTTLSVDKILDGSAGLGNAPTFGAGTKDVFVTLPASLAARKHYIDLADYAVDPTFTTDSTAGIQQAILDAYTSGISTIMVPDGHYMIAGPLVGSGNSQLYIPNTREAHPNRSIRIVGYSAPNFEQQGLRNVEPPNNGALFESTIMGSGSKPAVIGFEKYNTGDAWQWNYTNLSLLNLGIRTKVNARGGAVNSMGAINGTYAAQIAELDMLRIDVSRGLQDMPSPTAGSTGIWFPPVNNHLMLNGGVVYISGYNNAALFGEHTTFRNFISIGNINGIVLQQGYHASFVGNYSVEWNTYAIVINGDHDLHIGMFDAEHNTGTNFSYGADIKWQAGTRRVSITHSVVVKQSVGIDDTAFSVSDTSGTVHYKVLVGAGAN